jgi:hypothetical protein
MFWANVLGTMSTNYAFGTKTGSGRCYYTTSIAQWSLRSWGSLGTASTGYVLSATDPGSLAGWNHWRWSSTTPPVPRSGT